MSIFDLDSNDVPVIAPVPMRTDCVMFGGQSNPIGEAMSCVAKLSACKVLASGWGHGQVRDDEGGVLSVSGGVLAGLQQGGTYAFAGRLVPNGKYGPQLKLDSAGLHIPANRGGLVKFLTSNYKGLGQKSAEKIIAHYEEGQGLDAFRKQLLADPLGFDFTQAGVKRKTTMKGADGPKGLIYIDLATKVGGADIGDKLLRKLAAHLAEQVGEGAGTVSRAWQIFSANPYGPIRTLTGYAFRTADALAMKIGFDAQRVERLAALATHAIAEGCTQSGHSFLTHQDFARIIAKLDATVDVMDAVEAAVAMEEPIVIDEGRFYSQEILEAEMSLAKKLAWREKSFSKGCIFTGSSQELDGAIDEAIQSVGLKRDETQVKAIRGLLTTKATVHSITAGPGCGKTAIMEVVTKIIKDRKKTIHLDGEFVDQPMKIGFCAPTGKAAKVLNSRVLRFGLSATTIHSLLGVMGQGGFIHNRYNKLDLDLLVVDETSMVDLLLFNALMDAVEPGCHIVFLGDSKQLPSVGPGNVLADLMALPLNHYRLNQPHRNKGGILDVVNKAGEGEVEFVSMDDVRFVPQLPEATEQGIRQSVIRMYWEALKEVEHDFTRVGLLIARRKGDAQTPGWNVTYLNAVLRELYNPAPKNPDFGGFATATRRRDVMGGVGRVQTLAGDKVPGTRLRVNDRIIVRKNILLGQEPDSSECDEQVVNGDTGFIGDIWMHGGLLMGVELVLDDGRRVALPSSDTDILDLAYAMTVHAAQGSEYERVIFVCVNGTPNFVHRGIVFTAFSRAKKHLTVMGEKNDVRQVVARPMPKRNSLLCQRYALELSEK